MLKMTSQEINQMLPFILKRENVARYEAGVVVIGDRRKYPFERAFVRCTDVESVARAIETMVTQGGGPSLAALYALASAARQVEGKPPQQINKALEDARLRLVHTRPTNTALALRLEAAMQVARAAIERGDAVEPALLDWIENHRDRTYQDYFQTARHGTSLIEDGDGILTMCFAETAFILSLSLAKASRKELRVYAPETRPYLQGARLTAPSIHELGIPVSVITDNMPASLFDQGKIQKYFTAADLVTLDGHVVNKVGTLQNAILANSYRVPYFAFCWRLDAHKPDRASIVIEQRSPSEVKVCQGMPTTLDEIDALYPAFDITPPHLVAGIITASGVHSPYALKNLIDG
jgi:methylthioribose-1-phosphate isomerase